MKSISLNEASARSTHLFDFMIIFLLSAITVMSVVPLGAAHAQTTSSGATISSVNQNGKVLNASSFIYTALYGPGGSAVAAGLTSGTIATTAGSAYTIQAYGFGSCTFSSWLGGGSSNPASFTATSVVTAFTAVYYCSGIVSIDSSILVSSEYMGGAALAGVYAVLEQGSATVATGFTPVTFTTTIGLNYSVIISDAANAYFSGWSSGIASNTIFVAAQGAQTSLTAIFCPTTCSSDIGAVTGGTGPSGSITVTSSNLVTHQAVDGMYVDLRLDDNHIESGYTPVTFSGLQQGAKYLVVMYGYGDNYFRHFSNGNLQRYSYVTLNATAGQNSYSLNGLYETVPKGQAASLNIIAQFPNGTQIGTASEIGGYPQHTPGMYLDVTPPGSASPYTATFTGGSILPFIFYNGQTYTVAMSLGYGNITFSYWKDNGSTDPTRAVSLSGNSTIIAVYTQA